MAVLVFMYHKTPSQRTNEYLDVAMPIFCDQINRMLDEGCEFIRFSDALDERYYGAGTYISVTFDDGHKSNLDAFDFLRGTGIVPTAFIVSDWSRRNSDFISAREISGLADHCDFGGHGATHTALTYLSENQLNEELVDSKVFLEKALARSVTTMAVPGGRINDNVVRVAKLCGFSLIGNSVPLINIRRGKSINRVTMHNGDDVKYVSRLAKAGRSFWALRRARRGVLSAAVTVLGKRRYNALKSRIRR